MKDSQPICLVCHVTSEDAPLLSMEYRQATYHICPQHLPVLIHKPQTLAGILPGIESLGGVDHEH